MKPSTLKKSCLAGAKNTPYGVSRSEELSTLNSRTPLSRSAGDCSGFLARGYRKHPRLNLWGSEGCSYFLNARGQRLAHDYSPSHRAKQKGRGYIPPTMRCCNGKACHVLMGEVFYGERLTFINRKGKPYFGHCHHLVNDPLNYCPDNLLCWLTREQHNVADDRRQALEAIVPNGDLLACFTYARLRELQDPRTMSDAEFQRELAKEQTHIQQQLALRDPILYHLSQSPDEC